MTNDLRRGCHNYNLSDASFFINNITEKAIYPRIYSDKKITIHLFIMYHYKIPDAIRKISFLTQYF